MILTESLKATIKEAVQSPTSVVILMGRAETQEERDIVDFVLSCQKVDFKRPKTRSAEEILADIQDFISDNRYSYEE